MNNIEIDFEKLRQDLIDYVGPAISSFPIATADLISIISASDSELIVIAKRLGFNIENYIINEDDYNHTFI